MAHTNYKTGYKQNKRDRQTDIRTYSTPKKEITKSEIHARQAYYYECQHYYQV